MKWIVDDLFAGGVVWDLKRVRCTGTGTDTVGYVQRVNDGTIFAVLWSPPGGKVPPGFERAEATD